MYAKHGPSMLTCICQSTGKFPDALSCEPRSRRDKGTTRAFIHNLDDDSLLNIFRYYRPALLDKTGFDNSHTFHGGTWKDERWWYRLVKVCRRWRHLIMGSAYHLRAGLLFTYGAPVPAMLAHSPTLPLIIDYSGDQDITSKDKEDILLALQHRDRVRRIRLQILVPDLETITVAIDEEFPMLVYLAIVPAITYGAGLMLPKGFQAPRLRHLMLSNTAFFRGSPLLTTNPACLVTLSLVWADPSTYLYPGDLLQQLSCAPQLEKLQIGFDCPPPHKILRQMSCVSITANVTFPNLRLFVFEGPVAYLEVFLPCMTAPSLEKLQITFFYQPILSFPHLLQFLSTTQSPTFAGAKLTFYEEFISVMAYPDRTLGGEFSCSCLYLDGGTFTRQIASAAQIFTSLGTLLSAAEKLTLEYARPIMRSEAYIEADCTHSWRMLLRSLGNVKTLHVDDWLPGEMSHSLLSDDGGSPMDRLPKLKELSYSTQGDVEAFAAFADVRKKAGRPVVLVRI